ncbi:MAG TPA: hypothetical protein VHG51_10890 [Longimicrobiaceae bacterium]|nr:hypothetical protein [Longimicrobiaceae bacterium]
MSVRRNVLLAGAVLALAGCSGGGGTGPEPPVTTPPTTPPGSPVPSAGVTAGSTSDTFTPGSVDLTLGGTVTWSFGERAHEVIFQAAAGAPADIPATTSAQVARTFGTRGTFPYACSLHQGMSGTVTVH